MISSSPEISWFSALCDDDYRYLGVPDPTLRSSWEHCKAIVLDAERLGYDNILLPSGYQLGIDAVAFAAGIAAITTRIRLLVAVRVGELWPPQLARQLHTLNEMLAGRLTINIISSEMPGETLESEPRYRRTLEVMQTVRRLMIGEHINERGEFYTYELPPPAIASRGQHCPAMYFGGLSPAARDVAARAADVYLMWPETESSAEALIADMTARAAGYGRTLRFGFRSHVIVRETESAARAYARDLLSQLDDATGRAIRARSLDSTSAGVQRQSELRSASDDDGFVEDCLWTGIGRARSGCGAAIVGDPDQVAAKLARYQALGIDAFILSGYPHREECAHFAAKVLSQIPHGPLEL